MKYAFVPLWMGEQNENDPNDNRPDLFQLRFRGESLG
jgi:hypothetical protein